MARRIRGSDDLHDVDREETSSHWISYSDLMSALLLMFALFLMINILESKAAMEEKDQMIEELTGVRTKIIEELKAEFEHSKLSMEVDPQTGAIRFSSGVFFGTNESTVSDQGKEHLKEFIPKYIDVLFSEGFKDNVAQIIVEGHTDQSGTYLYNLDLSQERSLAVVKEILSDEFPDFEHKDQLRNLLTSNGRSFSELIYEDGVVNPNKSRRVEFKFRLKDEDLINKLQDMVLTHE
ncbi:OmpA family protein [Bacillus dakarensis]|uniref:OmpA family protein n=1 Tax=Robertmurraya dakarensis TaxID=1926278 RepID=UPI001115A962|nr:OmpA family protein [Bacillus dakarensis]